MQPLHILVIVGTRPEAIKLAPVMLALRERPEHFRPLLVATGQHREMLAQALGIFGLTPDLDLDIMQQRQTLAEVTCRSLAGLDGVFAEQRPDLVLVQGDTLAVTAGALAAFFHRIPVGHVEAGLRTGNRYDPFPEEMNRRLAAPLCLLHFAPTREARDNLLAEGIPAESIYLTGNTATDALLWGTGERAEGLGQRAEGRGIRAEGLGQRAEGEEIELVPLGRQEPVPLSQLLSPNPSALVPLPSALILMTAHRRENIPDRLRSVCEAVRQLARRGDVRIVYAVHPNPAVREVVEPILGGTEGVLLVEPPDFAVFGRLMAACHFIITDSGGLQEEAPTLKKPVLVIRETTERPEGVAAGVAELVGTSTERIVAAATRLLADPEHYAAMTGPPNPYGDGRCSERILAAILHFFGRGERPEEYG